MVTRGNAFSLLCLLASAAVLFMEHWKRRQMRLNYIWDLTGFGEEEEVSDAIHTLKRFASRWVRAESGPTPQHILHGVWQTE